MPTRQSKVILVDGDVWLYKALVRHGLSVSTLKHAHHGFEVDTPGKDSYEHRAYLEQEEEERADADKAKQSHSG